MKVLILKNVVKPDGTMAPNILKKTEVVDLPDEQAELLIDRGVAVEVKAEKQKPQKSDTPDDTWTVDELKAYAADKKIDLGEAKKKPEIIAAIQAATATA